MPVGRREYITSGVALALLKYAGDALIVWLATHRLWHPWDYATSLHSIFSTTLGRTPSPALAALAIWGLPFLWIGASMSMRRALDAGRSAWLALLLFVPAVNWLFILAMSALPTRQAAARPPAPRPHEERLPTALLAMAAGVAVGVGMLLLSVYFLSAYGVALFFGTPLVIGVLTAFLFNRRYPASEGESQQVVLMTMAILAGVALVTATEGAICLLMAAPLGVVIAAVGAALGRALAGRDTGAPGGAWVSVLVLPALASLDAGRDATPVREVRTAVEIAAPPEVVWRNVIAFPPLPEPSELVFRLGIAYPMSAELTGAGVGAVRHCNFSTGAFVEPITRWEPGRRLSFDVIGQPAPMREWSPWARITPPHLDGYFNSRRGEFRLIPLPGGRTRLEGSTWYDMRLEPAGYWALFGDAIIHRIHQRVLRHIQSLSEEQSPAAAAPGRSTFQLFETSRETRHASFHSTAGALRHSHLSRGGGGPVR